MKIPFIDKNRPTKKQIFFSRLTIPSRHGTIEKTSITIKFFWNLSKIQKISQKFKKYLKSQRNFSDPKKLFKNPPKIPQKEATA